MLINRQAILRQSNKKMIQKWFVVAPALPIALDQIHNRRYYHSELSDSKKFVNSLNEKKSSITLPSSSFRYNFDLVSGTKEDVKAFSSGENYFSEKQSKKKFREENHFHSGEFLSFTS
jgi:hypothetical protein